MEQTEQETMSQPPRRKYYPALSGEERLKGLRAIRGMWKGKAAEILERIEQGREGRDIPARGN